MVRVSPGFVLPSRFTASRTCYFLNSTEFITLFWAWGGVVVKALHYLSDDPGIDCRWCHWISEWHIPSDLSMALGPTQTLVKMSTRNISWGLKVAGEWGWRPHHLHMANVMKSGSLNLLEPSGPHRASYGTLFTFTFMILFTEWNDEARRRTILGLTPLYSLKSSSYFVNPTFISQPGDYPDRPYVSQETKGTAWKLSYIIPFTYTLRVSEGAGSA